MSGIVSVPDDLVSLQVAARLLGAHPSTVRRYVAAGKLAGWVLPGTHLRVSRASVLALLEPAGPLARAPRSPAGARQGRRAALASLRRAGYDV